MLSNDHLGLAFIFSLLFTPALYSSYPAQAIIAPLSVHKLVGGKKDNFDFNLTVSIIFSLK